MFKDLLCLRVLCLRITLLCLRIKQKENPVYCTSTGFLPTMVQFRLGLIRAYFIVSLADFEVETGIEPVRTITLNDGCSPTELFYCTVIS